MLQRFVNFIEQQQLIPSGRLLLAVSGGRDSVAMTDLMHRAGYDFAIAHCNFKLRGDESNRDQRFVTKLASSMGAPFFTIDFDTGNYASSHKKSIEEAARELRYGWFADICRQNGYAAVVTAHHADDSVETLFLNLFRGTGIAGLHGISLRTTLKGVQIVRPMLCFSRSDIDAYVDERKLQYVDDHTNLQSDVQRNFIRLRIMPLLRQRYPAIDKTMLANIGRFSEVEMIYNEHVSDLIRKITRIEHSPYGVDIHSFLIDDIISLSPRHTIMHEILSPYGFSSESIAFIDSALDHPVTGCRYLSPTFIAAVDRGRLSLVPRWDGTFPQVLVESGHWAVDKQRGRSIEIVDADKVKLPLCVRGWNKGDVFQPLGMNKTRLVSDFLKDCKVNAAIKERVPLLVDADGHVVWVVGHRLDNCVRVTDETNRMLRLELLQPSLSNGQRNGNAAECCHQ